jgi:hypothetical protein
MALLAAPVYSSGFSPPVLRQYLLLTHIFFFIFPRFKKIPTLYYLTFPVVCPLLIFFYIFPLIISFLSKKYRPGPSSDILRKTCPFNHDIHLFFGSVTNWIVTAKHPFWRRTSSSLTCSWSFTCKRDALLKIMVVLKRCSQRRPISTASYIIHNLNPRHWHSRVKLQDSTDRAESITTGRHWQSSRTQSVINREE